jgi:peptidoglycan hydrolase CwlO-like protein
MTTVKADVEQELRADELREILSQQQKELDSLKDTISDAGKTIEEEANVMDAVADSPAPAEATAATESPPLAKTPASEVSESSADAAASAEEPASKAKT